MGIAIYVSLEKPIAGVSVSDIDGKVLASALEYLDAVARACEVQPLSGFISQSASELVAMADELGIESVTAPEERWFRPEEGLLVVDALLVYSRRTAELSEVRTDLENVASVLRSAAEARTHFHLTVDF